MKSSRPCSRSLFTALAAGIWVAAVGMAVAEVPAGGYVFLPTAKEAELYRLIREDPQQMRSDLVLDPRLCQTARLHAEDTQRRRFFSHVNPDGENANQRALDAGFPLPAHYTPSQNYIESMAGSVQDTPADALANWRSSTPHATHVFGKSAFYRDQVVIGVGYAPSSRFAYATYVFLSAPLPVGENGAPATAFSPDLEIAPNSAVFLSGSPPESILEVWESGPSLSSWVLRRTVVVDTTGRFSVGTRSGPAVFFRLRYFGP